LGEGFREVYGILESRISDEKTTENEQLVSKIENATPEKTEAESAQ